MVKEKEKITVEARLTVTEPGIVHTVRRFDAAHVLAMDLARAGRLPVRIRLDGFVRKDSPKDEFAIRYEYDE